MGSEWVSRRSARPSIRVIREFKIPSLGLLFREKIRGRGRGSWMGGRDGFVLLRLGLIKGMEMFFLHLGHFAQVMAFTGVEEEEQTGEREERKQSKHARGE